MFITTSNGVPGSGSLSAQFSIDEAEDYVRKNRATLPPEMRSKLDHGIRACKNGVLRAHIIDGTLDDALLGEIFSNEGVGTMIYANEYQAIRRARKKDTGSIFSLIKESVAAQELAARTRKDIAERIGDFFVFEIDRHLVGCVALKTFTEEDGGAAELECLYVSESHQNQGIGYKLMQFIEGQARELGMKRLFALSTQAFNYFSQKGGFKEGDSAVLPPSRKIRYEQSGRRSKILFKDL
jgi:amino-acid N-acetyltransferase